MPPQNPERVVKGQIPSPSGPSNTNSTQQDPWDPMNFGLPKVVLGLVRRPPNAPSMQKAEKIDRLAGINAVYSDIMILLLLYLLRSRIGPDTESRQQAAPLCSAGCPTTGKNHDSFTA